MGATSKIALNFIKEYLEKNYSKNYELILGVRNKEKLKELLNEKKIKDGLKVRNINLGNLDTLKIAMQEIDVVLNLAANASPKASFQELLEPNLIGTFNILESSRLAGVKKVIMASSIHAVKGHEEKVIKEDYAPRPLTVYGATKAFVEALCHVYSQNYNMNCIVIRIGAYTSKEETREVCLNRKEYDYVISQRDMNQLIHKAIITNIKDKFVVLHGSSNNKIKRLDLEETKRLVDYEPEDDFYSICKK